MLEALRGCHHVGVLTWEPLDVDGGPTDTVIHDRTGLLCEPEPEAFATALATFVTRVDVAREMGRAGRDHVQRQFSVEAFGERLWSVVQPMLP